MNHKMEFFNPVVHEGLNITIRRGLKWDRISKLGDTVSIVKTGSEDVLRTGTIVGLKLCQFSSISEDELAFEHDPECTNKEGALKAMERSYPGFKETEVVTVVSFWI